MYALKIPTKWTQNGHKLESKSHQSHEIPGGCARVGAYHYTAVELNRHYRCLLSSSKCTTRTKTRQSIKSNQTTDNECITPVETSSRIQLGTIASSVSRVWDWVPTTRVVSYGTDPPHQTKPSFIIQVIIRWTNVGLVSQKSLKLANHSKQGIGFVTTLHINYVHTFGQTNHFNWKSQWLLTFRCPNFSLITFY